ncbi:MAG: hypothetical protein FWB84_06625 [Candidatus Bathyarchaeota archaeon]|uniref:hypothetical protein n=1 Tax=Candidatus Bathycorpusculum sp. TaxID=2994959 RepID=UPI0028250386|nr:hypothetical protein [Candidatus Termiticorpusculum sp.]MCL2257963.1 hypothetical protein [Candidatus Termiticorpusculum sp.]MCL2291655.1 hypothetical protein [Candidatus Termiticorpusculum sp.]
MTLEKMLKSSLRGWLPQELGTTGSQRLSNSRWKSPIWIIATVLVIVLASFTIFMLFSSEVSNGGVSISRASAQNGLSSFDFSKISNMTTPKVGDVFEVSVSVQWVCSDFSQFWRRVEIVDPYPVNNCRLISGNNVVRCSGYDGKAQITYLLEVIDDNPETFMMSDPLTALYIDGIDYRSI